MNAPDGTLICLSLLWEQIRDDECVQDAVFASADSLPDLEPIDITVTAGDLRRLYLIVTAAIAAAEGSSDAQ